MVCRLAHSGPRSVHGRNWETRPLNSNTVRNRLGISINLRAEDGQQEAPGPVHSIRPLCGAGQEKLLAWVCLLLWAGFGHIDFSWAMFSGPSGSGKTMSVYTSCVEMGYRVIEINPSMSTLPGTSCCPLLSRLFPSFFAH